MHDMSLLTKKALASSLKKLMKKRPLGKITIKDLVADCGVNRQTFYYHFQDIYYLLGWIYNTEVLDSVSDYSTYETWQQGFLKIFQYVSENREFCMNSYHSLGREYLESFLYDVVFDLLMKVVEEVASGEQVKQEDKKFIADFYTFAFSGIMLNWMKGGLKENPELIIKKLSILIEGDIEKAIKKYVKR